MPFDPGDPAADFVVWELTEQRIRAGRGEGEYVAVGTASAAPEDWGAAWRAVREAVPDELFGLPFDDIDLTHKGGGVWLAGVGWGVAAGDRPSSGEAPYGFGTPADPFPSPPAGGPAPPAPPPPPPAPAAGTPLGPEWSFDTTGATVKITQSLATRFAGQRDGVFSPVPDFKRAINVTKEGVEGVDVASRKLEFTYQVRAAYVTLDYVQFCYRITGTVNPYPFLGFDTGELLFMGVTGQSQTPTDGQTPAWTLSFKFAASPTKGDPFGGSGDPLEVAPDLTVPGAEGWDYVWVSYDQTTDGGRSGLRPLNVFVEQVYDYGDFDGLALWAPQAPPPPPPGP